MVYTVDKVDWQSEKDQLQQIRERVFVYELHIPKNIEFDSLDALAQHILVTDNMHSPVATGRLCTKASRNSKTNSLMSSSPIS